MLNWAGTMGKVSEWFWRFLAAVMLFAVGWTMWILHQLNAPPLVTSAAFEAAAKASAKQNAKGMIAPASPAAPPAAPKEPPINADKLKFSDSIASPAPERQ